MYEISNMYARGRAKEIFKDLEKFVNHSPHITEIALYSGDYKELLKLVEKESATNQICFQGRKLKVFDK